MKNEIEEWSRAVIKDWLASLDSYGPISVNNNENWPFTPRINWASLHYLKRALEKKDEDLRLQVNPHLR